MGETGRARLEAELARHYAAQRDEVAPETTDALVAAMVAEDARIRRVQSRRMGTAGFVASQVRYIPAWTWAAQAALVALMCVLAYAAGDAGSTRVCIGILSAVCVLVGVPAVHASKLHRVVELEYACAHDTASVLVARLIVLGCSSALAVALMVGATAPAVEASAFDVALWACPPYFLSCAGSLMVLRKASPAAAPALCVALAVACSLALLALASTVPDLYAHASLASWAAAAAAALAWLAREVAMTMRTAREGLDAFSPHLARTYN
jgi:hypothetical protein